MSEKTDKKNPFLLELGRVLLATLIATTSATWAVRGAFADYDRRISVLESQQSTSIKNLADAVADVRTDVRELRAAVMQAEAKR